MRIDPGSLQPPAAGRPDKAAQTTRTEGTSGAGAASGPDATAAAAEIQAATEAVRAAGDLRADRVAELRGKIERGELKVDAKRIADRMVGGAS